MKRSSVFDDDFMIRLREIAGPHQVVADPEVAARYEADWTGRFRGQSLCVVLPGNLQEVCQVVQECAARKIPIVPQGGATGLVGGGVPRATGQRPLILSTRRLKWISEVDKIGAQVTAAAGVTLAELQKRVSKSGLEYGVDFASRDSATVGGTVATNAGGVHVVARGMTRDQVIGVEAVLPNGAILSRLDGLVKDNTGYDLAGLLTGSEGTLAIITAARLRLHPVPRSIVTILASMNSVQACVEILPALRERAGLRAVELMLDSGLSTVCQTLGLPGPPLTNAPAYLLVDVAVRSADEALKHLQKIFSSSRGVVDATIEIELPDRRRLWMYREMHTEAVSRLGVPLKLDIAVPVCEVDGFLAHLASITRPYQTLVWGHIGEGSLHVNVVGPDAKDDVVEEKILALAVEHGGTISAEHGIGIAKARFLHLSRTVAEIYTMQAIKSAIDPLNLMNPGVLLSPQ
jgi:FAD/FMN-containing dehydrogenase